MSNPIKENNTPRDNFKNPYSIVKMGTENVSMNGYESTKKRIMGIHKQPLSKQKTINVWQNIFSSSISAMAAVGIIQPFLYFKNEAQMKTKEMKNGTPKSSSKGYSKNPFDWYRGGKGFALSFIPTIAFQTSVNEFFVKYMDPVLAAGLSGGFSATVVCPFELIMRRQQMDKQVFIETVQHIYKSCGFKGFYVGFTPTFLREMIFTAAYISASPLMKEKMAKYGVNEYLAYALSGIIAGAGSAFFTQHVDTAKTIMQSGELGKPASFIKTVMQGGGLAGLGWRVLLVACATTAIPFFQTNINKQIENFKK